MLFKKQNFENNHSILYSFDLEDFCDLAEVWSRNDLTFGDEIFKTMDEERNQKKPKSAPQRRRSERLGKKSVKSFENEGGLGDEDDAEAEKSFERPPRQPRSKKRSLKRKNVFNVSDDVDDDDDDDVNVRNVAKTRARSSSDESETEQVMVPTGKKIYFNMVTI